MRKLKASSTRRIMLWFFDAPSNDPYVTLNFDVDVGPLRGFLDAYAREHGVRVGVHHAVTRAVARCLTELPALNVKVLGHALYALDSVNIAMPVHLEAADGRADETGMTIVRDVQRLSLKAVAACSRARAAEERTGRVTLSGSAAARRLARFVPDGLLRPALDWVRAALNHPLGYGLVESQFGVSSAVTNVGAVFNLPRGARFRAASATIPAGFGPVATVFAVAPTETAAVVEDGAVVTRTVLPLVMMVDHRAVDGVLMARAASRVCEALLAPETLA